MTAVAEVLINGARTHIEGTIESREVGWLVTFGPFDVNGTVVTSRFELFLDEKPLCIMDERQTSYGDTVTLSWPVSIT